MDYANPEALVSTDWLAEHLQAPDVKIVDGTAFLPDENRDAREEYEDCHIPGAVFFDINDICDTDDPLPHMVPSAEKFSSRVRKLGLGDGYKVVVYDAHGGFNAAARVWWMFRLFGHEDVAVLDGGLPKWLSEQRSKCEFDEPRPQERHFTARTNTFLVRNVDQLIRIIDAGKEQVIDARNPGRFAGTLPEPRPCRKKGHIPGSTNLYYADLMNKDHHFTMRSADEIRGVVDAAGIDPKKPMVATCGSGVTACVIALGLYLIGHEDVAIYDGSWAEWGEHFDTPVET